MPDDTRLADLETRLAQREREIVRLERQRRIERELTRAEVIDAETATLLIERRIESDEALREADAPDIEPLIDALRRDKPFLFRPADPGPASSSSRSTTGVANAPRLDSPPTERLRDVADEARATGRLADLLRYLRARRRFHQRE